MIQATTCKMITKSTILSLILASGSSAYAHEPCNDNALSLPKAERSVTKHNAKKLVKELLKREYKGEGLRIHNIRKENGAWRVNIRRGIRTVATATVDTRTGNIHVD